MTPPAPPARANRNVRGILLRTLGVVCFAIMFTSLKWASADGVTTIEMLFCRSLLGLPIVLCWLLAGPGIGTIRTHRPRAHFIRSCIGVSGIFMNFAALVRLPLADAVTIGFSAPIFATILSALILGEKVGPQRWAAVALGFIGVAVIVRPGGVPLDHLGILFGIGGAIATAGVTVTIRQIGGTEQPGAIVFWFFIASLVVSSTAMPFFAQPHLPIVWAVLLLAGISGAFAQVLMTMSLHAAPVSVVSPFDYMQIIWATLLGWLVMSTAPTVNTLVGAMLIVASGLYTAWREHRLRKDSAAATPPLE